MSARTKVQRRGVSLGPAEIMAGARRGMSLGPSEISAGLKSRELGKSHESKRCDKKRSLSVGKSHESLPENKNLGTETKLKKKWQIPSDLVIHSSESDDCSPTNSVLPAS